MEKIEIYVSGKIVTREDKKDPSIDGRYYVTPVNSRGFEKFADIEYNSDDDRGKAVRKFLKGCCILPKSRTERYIAIGAKKPRAKKGEEPKVEQDVFMLTLESYKELAPYLREFGFMD